MPKQQYPKWVYGPDGKSQLVQTIEQHQALGPDWFEEPYDKHGHPPAAKAADAPPEVWPGDVTPSAKGAMAPKVPYPKWVYGPDEKSQLVQTEAQFEALGPGWFESPGEAKAGKAHEPVLPTVAGASTVETKSAPPVAPPPDTALNINALNVVEAGLYIDTLTDLEQLAALAMAEEAGKNRTTVKNAIGARINTLVNPPKASA